MRGANLSSCTACATGLHAVGDAATFIAMGRAKKMLAGAVEGCVNPIALTGFQRLRLRFTVHSFKNNLPTTFLLANQSVEGRK